MSNQLIFTVTSAGRQALASNPIALSYVAIGTGNNAITGYESALQYEVGRADIISGGVEPISEVLRFSAVFDTSGSQAIYELGLFTSTGVLFALARNRDQPVFNNNVHANVYGSFGVSLAGLTISRISIDSDDARSQPLSIMESHLANSTSHPRYLDKPRFNHLLSTVIPIGYLYHSHSTSNPKPLFDELLGKPTSWQRLTGRIIVGTDDNDAYVDSPSIDLGQRGNTVTANQQRPDVYPLQATHIWERLT